MGRLKDKLERRRQSAREDRPAVEKSGETSGSTIVEQLRQRMERVAARHAVDKAPRRSEATRQRELPGEVLLNEEGEVLVNRRTYPASYHHGRFGAAEFLEVGGDFAALAGDPGLGEFDPLRALFLDTETTGLSGGTGTLPFLVGVGWMTDDGRFEVEQLFCREPAEERAQLELLAARLDWADFLVTFNGKGFDVPLLNTRFVLRRKRNPGYALPHLDLLFLARRVFKRRLGSCRLGNLEAAVLGLEREGDIPGHAIPAAYGDYLRGGPVEAMEAVLEHNALDLVGLAALGGAMASMYRDPEAVEHAADHLGLARAALAAGERGRAEGHLTRAGETADPEESRDAYAMGALAAARDKDYPRALELWRKALDQRPDDAGVHLALAKLYEHREKDFDQALVHAARTVGAEGEEGSAHRIKRLERRLSKTRARSVK